MNVFLYTTEILRLTTSLPPPHALERVDGSAELRSPTCGSTVRADVQIGEGGRVEDVSVTVQACAFGQASASLVEREARGQTLDEVVQATDELSAWLDGSRADPGSWPGLDVLAPARAKRGRHGAILLPFRTLAAAMSGRTE